jgi:OmpA-OmpF porin, OOP family
MTVKIQFVSTYAFSFIFLVVMLNACSTPPRTFIPANANINEEVQNLEYLLKQAKNEHYDILATSDYQNSLDRLKKAKQQMDNDLDRDQIIGTLSQARGYYNRAAQTVKKYSSEVDGILEARNFAIRAGARNIYKENQSLEKIDKDLRKKVQDGRVIDSDNFNQLRTRYLEVEIASVQATEVGDIRASIDEISKIAKKQTPQSLDKAVKDMAQAENMIAVNVRSPDQYRDSVIKANESLQFLTEVVDATDQEGSVIPESVAVSLVQKSRKNQSQKDQLADQKYSLRQNQKMQNISKYFSNNEADVFSQGENVLIRLKAMNFSVGRADLPGDSVALLEKVRSVADSLNAELVVIEGHTDTTGSESTNRKLSQKRAEAVANYLLANGIDRKTIRAKGYSFDKPLGSNKTKEGRAMNRRVDVIITPESGRRAHLSTSE